MSQLQNLQEFLRVLYPEATGCKLQSMALNMASHKKIKVSTCSACK